VDLGAVVPVRPNTDARGRLVEIDFAHVPFEVRRAFTVTDVPAGTERGGHAHRSGTQALFCLSGRIEVELRAGSERSEVTLTPGGGGVCVPAGIWTAQRYAEPGSALLVLASEPFDPASYVRAR
jgi:hypothetical protein